MLIKILIGVVVVLVLFLIIVALQPGTYHVARSANILASPAIVFSHVNDFHKWEAWNPWGKMDPEMKQNYEGAASGPGAVYLWVGNNQVGEGRMTITESRPNDLVGIKLEFFKPMAGIAQAEFTFKPEGSQTAVTWSMSGEKNFLSKAFCLFMSMDKMIGGQFEKGLADLRKMAEVAAKSSLEQRANL